MADTTVEKNNEENLNLTSSSHDNIYGQLIVEETPELLSTSLLNLERSLENIPDTEKEAWVTALEKCPDLCGESFRLMFLRCVKFLCDEAAKRIVAYWNRRLELFTPSKAFLPMILGPNGAMKDDETTLAIGFIRVIPQSDDGGRPLLFADPSLLPSASDETTEEQRLSIARSFWYVIHSAIDGNDDGQRKGVVLIAYPKNVSVRQIDRALMRMNVESIRGMLPVRVSAFHVCHPPTIFRLIFPIMKVLMGKKLKKRIKIHYGSDAAVLEQLVGKYGIPQQNIPTELGGELSLNQKKWLQERQEAGL